ncbi:magnesium transporter [Desulfobotulus sp.]|jgi:magnesium transporter|uniref:magnesium transporter n=1 Tax=Desulfobotulus sp. TaxID=1940337 RepID=UPI002A358604|nr:magnesium transporter [Desulfobotulus sp.]MDY0162957.1 magnesium transporter [Desulfobotulus sp.]
MPRKSAHHRLHQPICDIARKKVVTLQQDMTIQEALDDIRSRGLEDKIAYFYVVDPQARLTGVLPTRKLLTTALNQKISDVMIHHVVSLHKGASILDAHDLLSRHKLLALPVVDGHKRILGVVDVGMLTDEEIAIADREHMDAVFESIGFRASQVRDASAFRAFRFRFPWLLATIASGTACALLVGVFELTLAKSLVLAFFLTLVLGLGESVSIQSMTVTLQALRSAQPTLRWYLAALRKEICTAFLLGMGCGSVVALIVWLWQGLFGVALIIGGSIALALCAASFFGLSIPSLLHALKLDPKIAAGPVTLAMADICTVLIYFSLATALL